MPAVIGISAQIALLLLVARLPGGPLLVTLALSLWALRSQQRAIQALAFTWLLVFANSALTQPLPLEYRLVVIVAAATGVHLRTRLPIPEPQRRLVLAVDVFVLFSVLGSFIVSYSLAVSLLKLALLWLTVRTVVIASTDTNDDRRSQNEWWVAFGKVLILASIPLLLLPAGFLRNARGFQGLLN
ncbi:MAG: hypothetical protein GWP04_12455, partial [Gammaproteobacteria bacterium]|nr:hypothetical protein [Gammaproteobacteria bacterium]